MADEEAKAKVNLTLYIDRKAEKVLFAEASKDFVDFLFHILSLPVGTVIKLLKERGLTGCLSKLYESIENLSESYLQPNQLKNSLLNPITFGCAAGIHLWLSDSEFETQKVYVCNYCYNFAGAPNSRCPGCGSNMGRALSYVPPSSASAKEPAPMEGGFVKALVSYLVRDNLEFIPISTKSLFSLLNKFDVKDVSTLEEMVVELGLDEALTLLRLSLECETVLTDAFIVKTGPK